MPRDRTLLLVDDDTELAQLLRDYLGREGYELHAMHDGVTGLAAVQDEEPALVLLDIMLPDLDGFEVLRRLRGFSTVPVIMLTAKGDEVDRIVGLELGADDYLPKPFNPRELTARIKAVLRRGGERAAPPAYPDGRPAASTPLRVGELALDTDAHRAVLGTTPLVLTTIEFALLRELMAGAGRVLSRDTLLDRVRGREFETFDRSIDVHISHLRQKLGDDPREPRFIRTVRSVGYQFIVDAVPPAESE